MIKNDLRRVDWRFLLSAERVKRSICFGDGRLAQGVATISDFCAAGTSTQPGQPGGDFDLAVAEKPNRAVLQAAFAALRPGGICYTEWQAWRVGGARRVRKRLEAAGFMGIRLYWVFPSPEKPRLWVPLQMQQAPGRYIANWLFAGDGLLQRAARQVFLLVFYFLMASGLVPYVSAVAHKAVSSETDLAVEDVFSVIQAEWPRFHPEIPVEKLRYLPQTGGTALTSKIVLRVFVEPEGSPRWVVKLSRLQENAPSLQCEQQLLRKLDQANKSSAFSLPIPEPLFSRSLNGILLYCQTALAGRALERVIKADTMRKYALQLTEWQAALMQRSKDWPREITSEEYVQQLIADLESGLAGAEISAAEFARVRAILSPLKGLPLTCVHNDFTVWNMIEMAGNLGVIDWVDGTESGLPLMDLVYGLSSMVFIIEKVWESPEAVGVYRKAIDPDTPTGRIFAESIAIYTNRVGLDPELIAPLRMLTWMLRCSFELKKRQLEADAPQKSRQSMYLSLWKAELDWQMEQAAANDLFRQQV